jgi:hypothetical protein
VRRASLVGASAAARSSEPAASVTCARTASQWGAGAVSPPEVGRRRSTRTAASSVPLVLSRHASRTRFRLRRFNKMITAATTAPTSSTAIIHPHGAEDSSEELTGPVVVVVVDWPVSAATAAPNRASTRLITPASGSVVVVVGAVVVVVMAGAVVVVAVGLLVVVLGGLFVVVVEASAMADDSEVPVLVVVELKSDTLVELVIGCDTLGPPDPHPTTTNATVVRTATVPTRRSNPLPFCSICTSVVGIRAHGEHATSVTENPGSSRYPRAKVASTLGERRRANSTARPVADPRLLPATGLIKWRSLPRPVSSDLDLRREAQKCTDEVDGA